MGNEMLNRVMVLKILSPSERKIFKRNKYLGSRFVRHNKYFGQRVLTPKSVVDNVLNLGYEVSIKSICKIYNIDLIKTRKRLSGKYIRASFSGKRLTIKYNPNKINDDDILIAMSHIFSNFYRHGYYSYPIEYKLKTADIHKARAMDFYRELKCLILESSTGKISKPKLRDSYGSYVLIDNNGNVIEGKKEEEMSESELKLHNSLKETSDFLDRLYEKYNVEEKILSGNF